VPDLRELGNVLRRTSEGRTLLADGFAQHVVGRVDEATAEQLEELGPPYAAGDEVGQFGLEQVFEDRPRRR
jgi:cell division protein FtsI/penicillin-binding protein 2